MNLTTVTKMQNVKTLMAHTYVNAKTGSQVEAQKVIASISINVKATTAAVTTRPVLIIKAALLVHATTATERTLLTMNVPEQLTVSKTLIRVLMILQSALITMASEMESIITVNRLALLDITAPA